MAGVGRAARSGGVAAALLLGAAALPGTLVAAEGDRAQVVAGTTLGALTVDVDDDGAAELLRITDPSSTPGLALEIWDVKGGAWGVVASTEVALHLDPMGEIASLVRATIDGSTRAVLVTGDTLTVEDMFPTVCCVELAEIRVVGGRVELRPMPTDDIRAEFITFSDLDGDGTDELITQVTAYHDMNDEGTFRSEIHRWDGDGFARIFSDEEEGPGPGSLVGDGDDRPGTELYSQISSLGEITRLVMVDGEVRQETGHVDLGRPIDGWIGAVGNGRIVMQLPDGIQLIDWRRGADPVEIGRLLSFDFPSVITIGEGPDEMLIVYSGEIGIPGSRPVATMYDMALRKLGTLEMSDDAAQLWANAREVLESPVEGWPLYPYSGPIPGPGAPSSWAHVANGTMIEPGGPDGYTSTKVSPMLGVTPIGRVGPDDAWLAMTQGYAYFGFWGGGGFSTYLSSYVPMPDDSSRLVLAPVDEALRPAAGSLVSIAIEGAVEVVRDGENVLLAPPDGFTVVVDGPPGTLAVIVDGPLRTEVELGDEPASIEVVPRRNRGEQNVDFERTLVAVTPGGRAQVETWKGTFVAEGPELTAHAETDAFELESRVYGRASEGVSVTVNSAPVAVNEIGAYSARVDAPIWPSDIVVVARDPLGNEATQRIEVVGFLDYRGLPWVPIFGLATVAAGGFLFVRVPHRRETDGPAWGDARLEEIDGDSV